DIFANALQFCPQTFDLLIAAAWPGAVIENSMPELLCPETGAPPAEKQNAIRPMSDCLISPEPHFARPRRHSHYIPTCRATLGLHPPEAAIFQPTHSVVSQSQRRRVNLLVRKPEAARIVVPGDEIEWGG